MATITAQNQTALAEMQTFAANANTVMANAQNYGLGIFNLINSATAANNATVGQLTAANATFQTVATALTSGNWANLNNNLVAYNGSLNGLNSSINGGMIGLTNSINALPGQMSSAVSTVIQTALAGVMAANSNLATSTNLANLAGLGALTNLAGVIVLTNIISELNAVNSNLLSMTNFGLSSETMQQMTADIGAAMTNATTAGALMFSNAVVINGELQRQFDVNPTNWPARIFTNGVEALALLRQITNGQDHIFGALLSGNATALGSSNTLAALEAQGILAGFTATEIRDAVRDLVAIQRTNSASLSVTTSNGPSWAPGSDQVAAGQLSGKAEVESTRESILSGNFQSAAGGVSNPFNSMETGITQLTYTPPVEPEMAYTFEIGGGTWSFDFNPMHNAMVATLFTGSRVATAWISTILFLLYMSKLASAAAQTALAPSQLAVPNLPILGNNVGALAAPIFVGLYVAAAAAFAALLIAKMQPGQLSNLVGDPLAGFAPGAIWLADQAVPIALILGQAVWTLTSSYSLQAAAWVFVLVQKFMVR